MKIGLSDGSYPEFTSQVGKHPAVNGVFVTWGGSLQAAFGQAHFNHARLMLHISTTQGYGAPEQITPRGIAQGRGDGYLLPALALPGLTPRNHTADRVAAVPRVHAGVGRPLSRRVPRWP